MGYIVPMGSGATRRALTFATTTVCCSMFNWIKVNCWIRVFARRSFFVALLLSNAHVRLRCRYSAPFRSFGLISLRRRIEACILVGFHGPDAVVNIRFYFRECRSTIEKFLAIVAASLFRGFVTVRVIVVWREQFVRASFCFVFINKAPLLHGIFRIPAADIPTLSTLKIRPKRAKTLHLE